MPTVQFNLSDLENLVGQSIKSSELEEIVLYVKGEIDSINGDEIKLDIKDTNRPDLWSIEGIARDLRRYLGNDEIIKNFNVDSSGVSLEIDKKVEKVRPKAIGAVIKNVSLSNYSLKQLIQLQEKIHFTHGRNRQEVAIGVYDYDKLNFPIIYTTVDPEGLTFVPVDFDKEMTPKEILKFHPKGREYGHLINDYPEYPLMIDSDNNALSIPPIINSTYTGKITTNTENIFIELTGKYLNRLSIALNVLVTALSERNGIIQSVEVNYQKEQLITPDLTPKKFSINPNYARKILGLDLSKNDFILLLNKAGYEGKFKEDAIIVEYPAYRNDILHERDVIEDVAIAYGINNILPIYPEISTIGSINPIEDYSETIRDLVTGLGYQEILTFSLTNKNSLFGKMKLEESNICEIANPISSNWSVIRNWLMPSLLEFLTYNQHVEFPQRIFEVSDTVKIDQKAETRTVNIKKLSCMLSDVNAGYEEISSILYAVLSNLGVEFRLDPLNHPSFITGRAAKILMKNKEIGCIGEIHPSVLNNWELNMPTAGFEIALTYLFP
jgi:phenylalanyl-tRNA synthetase beta chain